MSIGTTFALHLCICANSPTHLKHFSCLTSFKLSKLISY